MNEPIIITDFLLSFEKEDFLLRMNDMSRQELLERIVHTGPSENSWRALLELLFIWPENTSKTHALNWLENEINSWPVSIRSINSAWTFLYNNGKLSSTAKIVRSVIIHRRQQFGNEELIAIITSPGIENIKSLSINKSDIYVEGFQAMSGTANLANLSILSLEGLILTDKKFKMLIEMTNLKSLIHLRLVDIGLNTSKIEELLKAPLLRNVSELDISYNILDKDSAALLADSPVMNNLRSVNLNSNYIGEAGALAIVNAALQHKVLQLNVGKNELSKDLLKQVKKMTEGKLLDLIIE